MQSFSIDHDRETLIPFILSAKKLNPQLSIWASPWCPPAWMKINGHYASRYQRNCRDDRFRNGLLESQEGHEGSDMFRMVRFTYKHMPLTFRNLSVPIGMPVLTFLP